MPPLSLSLSVSLSLSLSCSLSSPFLAHSLSRSVSLSVCSMPHSVALSLHSSSCLLGHLSPLPSPPPPSSFAVSLFPYYSFFRSTFPSHCLHRAVIFLPSPCHLSFPVRCTTLHVFVCVRERERERERENC